MPDPHHKKPRGRATSVLGCTRCGKPCALVDDDVPLDGLCPWCRAKDSPRVTNEFLKEALISDIMES